MPAICRNNCLFGVIVGFCGAKPYAGIELSVAVPSRGRKKNKYIAGFHAFRRFMITGSYTKSVNKAINYSRYVVVLLVVILLGAYLMFKFKPTSFIPTEDDGRLFITFELPEASSSTRTETVLKAVMDILKETPGIGHFAGISGLNVVTFSSKSNSGTIFCQFKPWEDRKEKSEQLYGICLLQRRFTAIKGRYLCHSFAINGLGTTGGFSFILEQKESTDDIKGFDKVVKEFMVAANKRPEIARAFTFFTASTPGYNIRIDREKSMKLGVPLSNVFSTLGTYLGGYYINDFTLYNRTFRVMAQADTSFRNDISALDRYYVKNYLGTMIPMSTLMNYSLTEGAPLISHYNLYRSTEFDGDAAPGYSSGEAIQALREVAATVLPVGYGYEFTGLSREEISAGSKSVLIFGISLLFVFLFLTALYESWSVPFSVLLAVPLGAFGAILALTLVPRLSNNIYAQIGLITLIGLAAKNSILIVEYAKVRVDAGMDVVKATLEAVRLRLRPILMTSMAFIFGISPLIFASGAGAVARQTIGYTVLGGMLAATFIGVFMVPVLFVLITRLAYGKKKLEELKSAGEEKNGEYHV
jgi:HAE1 family hydrophobic/amphiphilic exporter-1